MSPCSWGWEGKGRYGSFRLRIKRMVIPWQCVLYLSTLEIFQV